MPTTELSLPCRPASVGEARHFLLQSLEQWGLQGLEYDASVVLSELVTNAILHAGSEVTIRLQHDGGVLRMEVVDASRRLPVTRHRSLRSATGRGLVLVGALASSWGADETPSGKVVWAEFTGAGENEEDDDASAARRVQAKRASTATPSVSPASVTSVSASGGESAETMGSSSGAGRRHRVGFTGSGRRAA